MENQKRESSGIKTHEEIIALFKELETMEDKIKNPELLVEDLFEPETTIQEVELPPQIPTDVQTEPQPTEPVGETPDQREKKRSPLFRHKKEQKIEKKIKQSHRWRKAPIDEKDLTVSSEIAQQLQEPKPLRSTFTLQFDPDGNLVGLPVKKPKPEGEKKGLFPFRRKGQSETAEQSEEEPVRGFKGKLKKITSKLRRKKSSEGESGGGIGGKLKGILRRKGKE